ncbi:MAG TPA: hypothetical protein VFU41_10155 [Gemmatimonadales bacterium]|nr:hypothetical protein [Gemmatimonadales bacterium]
MVSHARTASLLAALALWAACGDGKKSESPEAVQVTSADPRAAIFIAKGCPQCHSISALGVKSPAEVGPDLTLAYSDVHNRFGVKLEEFLHAPTGTMQMVLGQLIQLTPAERDSIIHILKRLHEEGEERGEPSQ